MNVKFKMPKFGRKLTGSSMLKELLLTVLATTISIVLTFGTAHYIEDRQAGQARKLMAMTIINDIDENIEMVKYLMYEDIEWCNKTLYLMDNIDRLDNVDIDSLWTFYNYMTSNSVSPERKYNEFKKSNENIFNSSQDSWRTIDERKFLNNVQVIYNLRAVVERAQKESVYFKKPFTEEQAYEMAMTSFIFDHDELRALCRKVLSTDRIKNYVGYSSFRCGIYRMFLKAVNMNEENKFLMNISEQDMEDFQNHTYMQIRRVKEHELVGTWNAIEPDDKKYQTSYEFRNDHTFTTHQTINCEDPRTLIRMAQCITVSGTWAIDDDSLVKQFDMSTYRFEVRTIAGPTQPDQANAAQKLKERLEGEYMKPVFAKNLEKNTRIAEATNIDEAGRRMELTAADGESAHYRKQQ